MKPAANISIHESQFPKNVRRDLLASLRTRKINHKFHYDSVKQTQKWLALHQIYSPSRNDADCAATYDQAFAEAVNQIKAKRVHVIGLGCGGGQKDTRLLKLLKARRREVFYTPCDVSTAMVLTARETARPFCRRKIVFRWFAIWRRQTICPPFLIRTHASRFTHRHFLRHDSEFRAAGDFTQARNTHPPAGFSAVQREPCTGEDFAAGMKKICRNTTTRRRATG